MAIPQNPDLLRAVLAHSADVEAIPDTTPTGQGAFSYRDGWPVITEVELEAGGIAPDRKFFNEIYRLLSGHTFFSQSGNVYPWVGATESFPGLNYLRGAHVLGSDYQEYVAKKPSGPEIPAEGGGFVGPVNPVGDASGIWMPLSAMMSKYELGEFYYFRHPTLRPGFQPAQGGLLSNVATTYPQIWAYLQTSEGQQLCKTEAQWQAMTTATWATLADGSKVGWGGIGGAPYYVQDLSAGTLRMPDLRGMYAEAAGFDSLGVGGVDGDRMRRLWGGLGVATGAGGHLGVDSMSGAFGPTSVRSVIRVLNTEVYQGTEGGFFSDRQVPVGNAFAPRRWGALACAYLGAPVTGS